MISYKEGNIFDAKVEALVNTVNTVGVMGKGIALQFKYNYPECYQRYKEAAANDEIVIGRIQVVPINESAGVKFILNFPTKKHWRNPSKIKWIKDGLADLRMRIEEFGINSIALPALGCGNGGLNWSDVKQVIEHELSAMPIQIEVYEPSEFVKSLG